MALCQLATNQCLLCRLVSTCYHERVSFKKKKSLSDEVQLTEEMYEKLLKKFVFVCIITSSESWLQGRDYFSIQKRRKNVL